MLFDKVLDNLVKMLTVIVMFIEIYDHFNNKR